MTEDVAAATHYLTATLADAQAARPKPPADIVFTPSQAPALA